ncbi:MAG: MFS transporter [Acidimicrobiales bacterium]
MRRYERLIAISISTVLVMAGQGVISPVLPLYAVSFGVSTTMVGATVTAFGLARLVTNIPAGVVADRRGRRILLIGGPLVTAVGMFGSGMSTTIWTLLAFRFVAGLGSGLYMTGAQIYLLDIAEPHERGRFMATNQGALLVGVGFGPALGGLLADVYSLTTPFFVVAIAAVVTAVYGYLRLPETLTADDLAGSFQRSGRAPSRFALLRSSNFLALGMVSIGVFSVRAGVRQTLVPLQLTQELGVEVAELGVLFTALGLIGIVLIWPAGWATDRFGHKLVIVPTALLISTGIGIVAFADSLTVFIVGLTISAFGSSITGPAPAAYVAELVADDQRGAAMGLYRTFGDIGVVVSPVLSGVVADTVSIPFAIGMNAAFVGLAGLGFWLVASSNDPTIEVEAVTRSC